MRDIIIDIIERPSQSVRLKTDADTEHATASDWFEAYGRHVPTQEHGDVVIQAISYDWLDDSDQVVIEKVKDDFPDITHDEAEALVTMARAVKEAALSVSIALENAVTEYRNSNLDGVKKALVQAYRLERDHGDWPASRILANHLLGEIDID